MRRGEGKGERNRELDRVEGWKREREGQEQEVLRTRKSLKC